MTFKVLALVLNSIDLSIEFRTVKNIWSAKVTFSHHIVTNSFG